MRVAPGLRILRVLSIVATAGALASLGAWQRGVAAESAAAGGSLGAVKLADVGSTRRLEILPLVDWTAANPQLRGEAGVSYLLRTDHSTILFDVGGNLGGSDPSPLVANMKTLGITLDDIDTIVISHNHMDHVGGRDNVTAATFSLGRQPAELAGKKIVVPTMMSYPGVKPHVASEPAVIAPGVATTGSITGKIYIGPVDEQALAIRVEGKGIVLIVGCGHQGLDALLARTAQMFAEPLYGVVGGLHYPIPHGRWKMGGIDVQRWASYGLGSGPSAEDVQRDVDKLRATGLKWISLSPHDSSDEMIELFRRNFGGAYHDLRVGEVQALSAAPQQEGQGKRLRRAANAPPSKARAACA